MSKQPLVSAIVAAYNGQEHIGAAIDSALSQTHQPIEVVVVDDGSSDDTLAVLEQYRGNVVVITQQNAGVASARNRAIAAATGDFIAFLDQDDLWEPTKIAKQLELIRSMPDCAFVHTGRHVIDEDGKIIRTMDKAPLEGRCLRSLLDKNVVTASSVLVRASRLPANPLRPGMPGCDDWDLWLRLAAQGGVGYIPEPLIRYRLHGDNFSSNLEAMTAGMAGVMDRFIEEQGGTEFEAVARQHRQRFRLDLAHFAFERGDFSEARARFRKAGRPYSGGDLQRWAASYLPAPLTTALRRIRGDRTPRTDSPNT